MYIILHIDSSTEQTWDNSNSNSNSNIQSQC